MRTQMFTLGLENLGLGFDLGPKTRDLRLRLETWNLKPGT